MTTKVVFLPEVRSYFMTLSEILYNKEYFGFEESAIQYVEDLFYEIRDTLPKRPYKPAPRYFERYGKGMSYSIFKKNRATQWFVFFNIYENQDEFIYLVRYISNNHLIAHRL